LDLELKRINTRPDRQKQPCSNQNSSATHTGAKVGRQATTTPASKTVTTTYPRASPNQPHTTPPAITYHNTPINPVTVICYNCDKDGHFALSYLELKNIGDIKEIEEGEISNKLEKEKL